MARRPRQMPPRSPLTEAEIVQANYQGSSEHKAIRWWGGLPGAYADASGTATRPKKQKTTICTLTEPEQRDDATSWVRQALRLGQYRYFEADQLFPNHVWYRDETGQVWFGRCFNSVQGHYKGWPINEDERHALFG
jgi:hypothetical protein